MTCQNCVRHVTEALREVPGIRSAEVSLEQASATVQSDHPVDMAVIRHALVEAGYNLRD